ncbi:RNA polymerase sigma factor [Cellulomonas hominis]|uniref:RNA polymerase sigma factor n=1 Tax=Cellulomonas hominis TaxID=156981 RepID=UPI001444680C|nr:sigma-70 family RNA polymerase sigma factor [Cellulomonas hominis]NKY10040.1 sigma-70 family RNA polymerase sigma factor [Cellulomonas hominis]
MEDAQSDADLLARARTHPEILGVLYERHAVAVHRYLSRRVGTGPADDLLGEVFLAAVEARLRVQPHPSGSTLPWLYGIAGNVVRGHLRRRPGWTPALADDVDWDAVDDRVDAVARRGELRAALGTLSVEDRQIVLLVAWDGLTPTEAADALGISPVAARSRLHRARSRAQAALATLEPTGQESHR